MDRINYRGQELLPVKRDIVFKAVFAGDGDLELLASLLSSILDLSLNPQDLEITNTELPPVHESGKLSRMDIRIKTKDKKHINVEIQLNNEHNMINRSLFYLSRLYVDQMTAKMRFEELSPVIAINILDFSYLPQEYYHSRHRMTNIATGEELTDIFEMNFIELPKIPRTIGSDLKDLWMQYIAADNEEVLDMLADKSPVLDKAVKKLVYVSADEQLRYEHDMREKAELDYWSAMKTNFVKGKEEGVDETKRQMIQGMKRKNIPDETIAEISGLPIEKIKEIQ